MSLQLLRMQLTQWDYKWVDPLDQCKSEAMCDVTYDNDNLEASLLLGFSRVVWNLELRWSTDCDLLRFEDFLFAPQSCKC